VLTLTIGLLYFDRTPVSQTPAPTPEAPPRIIFVTGAPGCATTGRSWILEGFRHPIWALAFSPNGNLLASGGGLLDKPGDLRLWDVQAWKEHATLVGNAGCVNGVDFSPDATLLVTNGYDRTLRLWDVATGDQRALVSGATSSRAARAFAPNGKLIAFLSFDSGPLMAWDLGTGHSRRFFPELPFITCLAFDPAGWTLAVVTPGEPDILLLDATTGGIQAKLKAPARSAELAHSIPWYLSYSRDGCGLAGSWNTGSIEVWDVTARRLRFSIPGRYDWPQRVALRPDGGLLASGDFGGTLTLRDGHTGHEVEMR
jgi:WD40 repeat protein